MASVDSVPQQALQIPEPTPQRRRHRRGGQKQSASRGKISQSTSTQEGPSGQMHTDTNASLELRPASKAPYPNPSSAEPSSAEASATENGQSGGIRSGGSRGGGRSRGIGRGGAGMRGGRGHMSGYGTNTNGQTQDQSGNNEGVRQTQGLMVGSSRQFGGRLTQEAGTSVQNESTLNADAPEFHPGQIRSNNIRGGKTAQSNNHQVYTKAPRARRQSLLKSTAPDIATRTHEDIASGIYECPICTNEVARNSKVGQPMKGLHKHSSGTRTGIFHPLDSGDVRVAICPRMFYPLITLVGVRKKPNLGQSLVFHLTHADRPAVNIESYRRNAPILANFYVMLVHVLRVRIWGLLRAAFAARLQHPGDALIRTTIMGGVVARYVEI
ncbi:hypothetical protein ABVK25_009449 [Lepraria finkii]|uniref:Uncharacterized protein n=1 Tax=Lepraria finkii TaxID=1340010 RepID=A0ABR4B068_9LECA